MIEVRLYKSDDKELWNEFISSAKNATFLFNRDFMEYHKHRFEDYSLMCFDKGKLIAVMPANLKDGIVYSHQGLTYGGVVVKPKIRFEKYILIFRTILKFFSVNKIQTIYIKDLPSIYSDTASEELEFIHFLLDSSLHQVDISSSIFNNNVRNISNSRLSGYKKGVGHNLSIIEDETLDSFWEEILIPNLLDKHNVSPTHNVQEISKLKKLFPNNIRQFNVYHNKKIVGGTTLFETEHVIHSQYISANSEKNTLGSLDFLYHELIFNVFKGKKIFDFGISTANSEKKINKGLLFWKEGFGARATAYKTFKINTSSYNRLDNIFS